MILQIVGYVLVLLWWTIRSVRRLLNKKKRKEAFVFASLNGLGAVLGPLLIAQVPLPSFIAPAVRLFEPIGKWISMS
ncbi:hypothetical protein [Paenibacillus koleovorans]|uniref:hypothetical protein n=1 Tax=Paenibacillus koleovorans TaxID=121608 RepID=UPI000FD94517|nr:hypothetical protein [Paenibacillus koleovorans]